MKDTKEHKTDKCDLCGQKFDYNMAQHSLATGRLETLCLHCALVRSGQAELDRWQRAGKIGISAKEKCKTEAQAWSERRKR